MNYAQNFDNLDSEIRMGMNLVDQAEFTKTIRTISHIAAETVKKTLGPYAHTTIIDDGNFVYPTKDGWAVLSRLRFQDPTHNSIYGMLKNISARIVDKVGDGTTTAMIAADHFMSAMTDTFGGNTRYRQKDVVDALNIIRDGLIDELKENAIQIAPAPDDENPSFSAIYDVAFTSSNGNTKLATIMQEIYQKTKNPNVMVDMEGSQDLSYEIQSGYRLDCSDLMHERYVNTSERYYASNHTPHYFVLFDHSVSYQREGELIQSIMNYASGRGGRVVFMAPNYDDITSAMFSMEVQEFIKKYPGAIPRVMVIQIPEMSTALQQKYVRDFAALADIPITDATKTKIFMELRHNERTEDPASKIHDSAMEIDTYNFTTAQDLMMSCMGMVDDFVVGKNFIRLNRGNFNSVVYKERMQQAMDEYGEAKQEMMHSTTSLMKNYLEASQRLAKLSGALGVIHVGGTTDLERQCMRDVVDDTFRACRSAYENGVVCGLNMGTLVAIRRLAKKIDPNNRWQMTTLDLLQKAYTNTTLDVLRNKKDENELWEYGNERLHDVDLIARIAENVDDGVNTGYDVVSESVCINAIPTVVNSVATDMEILNAIVGILGTILTSDQYLSVSRMYDKSAAFRQQSTLNDITVRNNTNSILAAVDQYLSSKNISIADFLKGFVPTLQEYPHYMNPSDDYADYLLMK